MNKFSKIKQHIYLKIESGEWPENHPVSSENALSAQFSVSRMTARRALQELADEYGVSAERIRQIEARAMSKLRHPSSDTGARDLLAV